MREMGEEAAEVQDGRSKLSELERVPGYLSVKEVAQQLGVSERTIYGYLEAGRLSGARIGSMTVIKAESLKGYRRRAPGRVRTRIPRWHVPPENNLQYLTSITVPLRSGQSERLTEKLLEIRVDGKHLLPGTAARYIARNRAESEEIHIVLVWRSSIMPSEEEKARALKALAADLAEVVDWERALCKEEQVIIHA